LLAVTTMFLLRSKLLMVRGCFCDCFGPMTSARAASQDKPLDPEDVKKCLQKFRAYEARQEMMTLKKLKKNFLNYATIVAVSVIPSFQNLGFRPPSPPPSYSSVAGSLERSSPTAQSRL
uniref:Pepsin-I3 domain-containing protein n=1 Tax=Heligmosomoides polygyrus TaxID=6339 RepID=A0A183FH52_HELPZ